MILVAGLFLLFLLATFFKDIYTEALWFESVGFRNVYFTILLARTGLFVVGFLAFLVVILGNLALARRLAPRVDIFQAPADEVAFMRQMVTFGATAAAIFLAVIFGSVAATEWTTVLSYLNGVPFGKSDPIFGEDLSFFVFILPFLRFLQMWWVSATIVTLIGVGALYAFTLSLQRMEFRLSPALKAHLSALGALILLLFAVGYWMDAYELLFSRHDVLYGASYTDVNARLLAYRLLTGIAAISAVLLLVNVFLRGGWLPVVGLGLWGVVAVLAGWAYPEFVQRVQVRPNEQIREAPYIANNIRFTREAFGLDRVEEQFFPAEELPGAADIVNNPLTIDNIRLWDHEPLRDTYNQIQSIRLYYDFVDLDVDRYVVDGQYRQVMLGARELSVEKLEVQAQRWVNQRLQFTHGYGVAMSPVNEFSEEGLPTLWLKDVPPVGIFSIDRPEIYYGEKTNHYVIVNTDVQEFDYPKEDQNVYTVYQGEGGVLLNSWLRRLVYAWEMGDGNLLLTEHLTPESRILYRRNIQERIARIAPFLRLDEDPYIVVHQGRLVWIQDAYTMTDRYPYSEPLPGGRVNYIRNSVKITVDAYDGSVVFYMAELDGEVEPLVRTWARIFPGMFRPLAEMPEELRSHTRYPTDLFRWQSERYRVYHMQDPQVFYNREDAFDRPREIYLEKEQPMQAYYAIMRLPGADRPEFLLMLPFTPVNKNNTIAWLAARSDGDNYGRLIAFKFPKDRLIFGPMQVESRINQDPTISPQFTLWSQAGTRVLRGNLLMIPIERSFIYAEPIYLQSETSQIPELKRVIIASGPRIAMEPSLTASLTRVFGELGPAAGTRPTGPAAGTDGRAPAPGDFPGPAMTELSALARQAQEHYSQAQEALRQGDWATFGRELREMEQALADLAARAGSAGSSPGATPTPQARP
ncbi:MAG: UPF0182 family protein [Chloroflexi bacterium]|nr:UPF0182 family protein [Chloroflexota bacterium]